MIAVRPGAGAPGVPVVRLTGVTAAAGEFTLGPVDLEVAAGTIHVVLGPNGAGKTTLLDLVVGLRGPDDGTVEVEGRAPDPDDAARYRRLGFAPDDERSLPLELTAPELWELCARLHARVAGDAAAMATRADEVAARLRFDPPPYPLRAHSHGMRRKAQLVAALLHDPPLVVLDEPTNGLDPLSAHDLGTLLAERAAADGVAVLVTTHDLMWTLRFADQLTVLVDGEVRYAGPPGDLVPAEALAAAAAAFDELADGLR